MAEYKPYIPVIEEIPEEYEGSIIQMVYGKLGTGKSEYGASIGPDGLVLSIGAGEMTLSSPGFKQRYPREVRPRITYIKEDIDPKTGLFKSAEAFDKVCDTTDWFLASDFRTFTIDDATFLTKFARNKAVEANYNASNDKNASSLVKSRDAGFLLMDIGDYGKEMSVIDWYLSTYVPAFKAAKKNFILLAHERHIFYPAERIGAPRKLKGIKPGFTGETFPDSVGAYFDLIWRFEVMNGTAFRAWTMPTLEYDAKTRWSGQFKEKEERPRFVDVESRIRGGKLNPDLKK
jgi:hypothetical protein